MGGPITLHQEKKINSTLGRYHIVARLTLLDPLPCLRADLREELKRLNGEVLRRFTSLIENLVEAPSQYERRVEEVTLLFNNLHHLLNAIRPSQARATLEHVLREQVRQKREKLTELRERAAAAEAAMTKTPTDLAQTVEAAVEAAAAATAAAATGGDGMQVDG